MGAVRRCACAAEALAAARAVGGRETPRRRTLRRGRPSRHSELAGPGRAAVRERERRPSRGPRGAPVPVVRPDLRGGGGGGGRAGGGVPFPSHIPAAGAARAEARPGKAGAEGGGGGWCGRVLRRSEVEKALKKEKKRKKVKLNKAVLQA